MLVLTTMFINVSNNLPKTSYMKMVDVWLLFNLLLPFIIVLLHTYMDTLRNEEERELSQINEDKETKNDSTIVVSSYHILFFSRGTRAQHLTLSVWCVMCGVCVVCGVPWLDAML